MVRVQACRQKLRRASENDFATKTKYFSRDAGDELWRLARAAASRNDSAAETRAAAHMIEAAAPD